MPTFDGTGPQGQGPMTGRGMGRCAAGRRFGFGCGRGIKRGLGRFFNGGQAWSKEDLEEYKQALQEELEDVEKELKEPEKSQV